MSNLDFSYPILNGLDVYLVNTATKHGNVWIDSDCQFIFPFMGKYLWLK